MSRPPSKELLRQLDLQLRSAIDELPDLPKAPSMGLAELQVMQSCLAEALALLEPPIRLRAAKQNSRRPDPSAAAIRRLRELLSAVRDGLAPAFQEAASDLFPDLVPYLLPDGSENSDVGHAAMYLRKFLGVGEPPTSDFY